MSSTIVLDSTFSIHVPRVHPATVAGPRCHVRRRAGGAESVVSVPLIDPLAGPPLAPAERAAVLLNLQLILDEWERING